MDQDFPWIGLTISFISKWSFWICPCTWWTIWTQVFNANDIKIPLPWRKGPVAVVPAGHVNHCQFWIAWYLYWEVGHMKSSVTQLCGYIHLSTSCLLPPALPTSVNCSSFILNISQHKIRVPVQILWMYPSQDRALPSTWNKMLSFYISWNFIFISCVWMFSLLCQYTTCI
jgi:hypothetical protein